MEKSLFYWQLSIPMFCTLYALRSAKQNFSIDFLCSSILCLSFLSFFLTANAVSYDCATYSDLILMPVWPAMHVVAEWEYLLGTMSTGIPRECMINVWLGILHRLVHIPAQFVSSKNLQGVGLMAKIPSAIKTLMMIVIMMVMMVMEKEREPWSIKLVGADWFSKCLRLVTCMGWWDPHMLK